MNGARLAAKFAFGPNCLDYCGSRKDSEKIFDYACGGKGSETGMQKIFSRFRGMGPYLELIAAENGRKKFDYEVAEAYWLGNELLESVSRKAWREMILSEFARGGGLSTAQAKAYAERVKGKVLPHHSFHVMTVFTLGGMLEHTIPNIDSCRVPWGKIIEEKENSFVVEYRPIVSGKGGLEFGEPAEREVLNSIPGKSGKLVSASEDESVAFHWRFACKALDEREAKNLENCVSRNMRELNAQSLT